MNSSRYLEFEKEKMILRDHLALERTAMANERTLLAYVRTMIGLIAVGGTFIKLLEGWMYVITGWLLISLGAVLLVVGFIRYTRIEIVLSEVAQDAKNATGSNKLYKWFKPKKQLLTPPALP